MHESYIHPIELSNYAAELQKRVDAVNEIRARLLTQKVALVDPRTFIGRWVHPLRLKKAPIVDGIFFGHGAFQGALVFVDEKLRIAVPYKIIDEEKAKEKAKGAIARVRWFRLLRTTNTYVNTYLTTSKYMQADVARANIIQAMWYLEQLLPNQHELKVTKEDSWLPPKEEEVAVSA